MDLCRSFRWVLLLSVVVTLATHLWLWINHSNDPVKPAEGKLGGSFQRVTSSRRVQQPNIAISRKAIGTERHEGMGTGNTSKSMHPYPSKSFKNPGLNVIGHTVSNTGYNNTFKVILSGEKDKNKVSSSVVEKIPPPSVTLGSRAFTHTIAPCNNGRGFFTQQFCLPNDTRVYFHPLSSFKCLIEGTAIQETARRGGKQCVCRAGWSGFYCNVPEVVEKSDYPSEYGLGQRSAPRRIIYAFPFNQEFDLLEAKLAELHSVVDVFLILESNYTASGSPKDRLLLRRLREGFLSGLHDKIVYISLNYFPPVAYANGWVVEELLRNHIAEVAFGKILTNVMDDDLFILSDVDEIPKREALLYLKVHYGYPEPFGFALKHTVFGFYWKGRDGASKVYGGCSIKMLREVFALQPYQLRSAPDSMHRDPTAFQKYHRDSGGRTIPWVFGSKSFPAGWHCSWCSTPEGIQHKLLSAHVGDFPRWGSDKKKTAIPFIQNLVQTGTWFDETTRLELEEHRRFQDGYAPEYIFNKPQRFSYLLNPPIAVVNASNYSLPHSTKTTVVH